MSYLDIRKCFLNMVAWFLNKYKLTHKDKIIDKRLRRKFYRAYEITKKMKKSTPEYSEGYFDGADLDEETREFIKFINS